MPAVVHPREPAAASGWAGLGHAHCGGELDLQHQTGSTYGLTLTLYFDAINGNPGALDQSRTAGIVDKATNRQLASVVLPLTSNTFINYTNPACAVGSLSTRKLLYTKNCTLDAAVYTSASGYYVAVERAAAIWPSATS